MLDQIANFVSAAYVSVQVLASKYGETILFSTLGIVIYSAIFGTLYTYLSKRVLYKMKHENISGILGTFKNLANFTSFVVKYTILFPAITFVWFALLSASLFLLSRTASLEFIFIISISVVAAVRILAYYSEEISVDLAKTLPLALLAVLLVEPTLFSLELIKSRIIELINALPQFAAFIIFVVILEWLLRILYSLVKYLRKEPISNGNNKN